ncbi:MAG: hypothetical protein KF865_11060 [Bdellovibrionaceae bacterium]|nr:hypothetical protein [Pseudobdellovibrionaceae bacterium]
MAKKAAKPAPAKKSAPATKAAPKSATASAKKPLKAAAKPAKPLKAAKPAKSAKSAKPVKASPAKAAAKEAPAKKAAVESAPKKALKSVMASVVEATEALTQRILRAPAKKEAAAEEAAPAVAEAAPTPAPAPVKAAKAPKTKTGKSSLKLVKGEKPSAAEDETRWGDLHERYKSEKPQVYDMKATFEAGRPLQHKVLGWGWIMTNENDRLEVLFKDGRRILISNYNPNR